jgi:hypothetical protein
LPFAVDVPAYDRNVCVGVVLHLQLTSLVVKFLRADELKSLIAGALLSVDTGEVDTVEIAAQIVNPTEIHYDVAVDSIHALGLCIEVEGVETSTPRLNVPAHSAEQKVVTIAAEHTVVAGAAFQVIVASAAVEKIVIGTAVQIIDVVAA